MVGMPLLIDGHNLIGKMPDMSLADPNDELKLVSKLQAYAEIVQKRIVVIFDPNPLDTTPVIARQRNQHGAYLTAIFAEPGMTADRLIRDKVSETKDRQGLTVITSDNAVASFARQSGIRVQPAGDFAKLLVERTDARNAVRTDVKPAPSRADVKAWAEVFTEPPQPPKPVTPPPVDEVALKRTRRMEQLKKQVGNQRKVSLVNNRPLTARDRELLAAQLLNESQSAKMTKKK